MPGSALTFNLVEPTKSGAELRAYHSTQLVKMRRNWSSSGHPRLFRLKKSFDRGRARGGFFFANADSTYHYAQAVDGYSCRPVSIA